MAVEETLSEKALANAFEAVLKDVPVQALTSFIKQANLNIGGMRMGKPGCDVFMRQVIVTAFASKLMKKHDVGLATLLRAYMAEARLLKLLEPNVIAEFRGQLTVFFGKARFILALLMDRREAVRTDAAKWCEESGAELPDEASAQTFIREAFSPVAAVGQGAAGAAGSAQVRAELADTKKRLEEAKKEAKRERREWEETAAKVAREQKDLLASKDFAIAEGKRVAEALENRLKREEANRNLRINELLSVRQVQLFGGWLKPACDVEALLNEAQTLPILARAEAVLAAQQKVDRAASRRAEAEAQLAQIETLLEKVEAVLATAHHVLPETTQLRDDLLAQRDAHRAALKTDLDDFSAIAQEMAARIDSTTDLDYRAVRDWLKMTATLGAITKSEADALWERFKRRAATWATPPEELDPDTEAAAIRRRNPHLAAAFEGCEAVLLFLDGHNMLNGMGRYRTQRGKPQTHEDARKQVEKDIQHQFAQLPLVAVHLVWDGAAKSQHNLRDNVLVHFSGGVGEHRADKYILSQLDYFKQVSDLPMVLVSDDHGFGGDAKKRGAEVCSLYDFEAFLHGRP